MRCIYEHLYYMQTQSEITLADNADKLYNQSIDYLIYLNIFLIV